MLKSLIKFILFFTLVSSPLYAETCHYFIGSIPLAGMVPAQLPESGTLLSCEQVEQPLVDPSLQAVGFIPVRFREPIRLMMEKGLLLQFEVVEVYKVPQPGRFMSVELWVTTDRPEDLKPLIYAIPLQADPPLLALED